MDASDLILYQSPGCIYCLRVRQALQDLGVSIAMRDVWKEPQARQDLLGARGRATVPVLRIEDNGSVRWMGESQDIIRYLNERFGERERPPPGRGMNGLIVPLLLGIPFIGLAAWSLLQ